MKKANYYDTEATVYGTIKDAISRYRLSRKIIMEYAQKADALISISPRLKRINFSKLDDYFESLNHEEKI